MLTTFRPSVPSELGELRLGQRATLSKRLQGVAVVLVLECQFRDNAHACLQIRGVKVSIDPQSTPRGNEWP